MYRRSHNTLTFSCYGIEQSAHTLSRPRWSYIMVFKNSFENNDIKLRADQHHRTINIQHTTEHLDPSLHPIVQAHCYTKIYHIKLGSKYFDHSLLDYMSWVHYWLLTYEYHWLKFKLMDIIVCLDYLYVYVWRYYYIRKYVFI